MTPPCWSLTVPECQIDPQRVLASVSIDSGQATVSYLEEWMWIPGTQSLWATSDLDIGSTAVLKYGT